MLKKEYESAGRVRLAWIASRVKQLQEHEKEQMQRAFDYALNMRFGSESQINSGEDYYKEKYG